jgi:hypothetical protein
VPWEFASLVEAARRSKVPSFSGGPLLCAIVSFEQVGNSPETACFLDF